MTNRNNAQITGDVISRRLFLQEDTMSLTTETLSLVGTAKSGPAFVPQQVISFDQSNDVLNTWENIFGPFSDQLRSYGPITSKVWIENSGNQLSYTRILGVGVGDFKLNNDKSYNHAGFVVGEKILAEDNPFAVPDDPNNINLLPGKTYFEGKVVKEKSFNESGTDSLEYTSPFEDYFEQINVLEDKIAILTDVLFVPQGISLDLQQKLTEEIFLEEKRQDIKVYQSVQNKPNTSIVSNITYPMLYLKGLSDSSKSIINIPKQDNKFRNFTINENNLNSDHRFILERGHLNYCSFRDVSLFEYPNEKIEKAKTHSFLTHSKDNPAIDYEDFRDVFRKAKTPWVVSQPLNPLYDSETDKSQIWKSCKELFRFHTYSDGEEGNKYRFKVTPLRLGNYGNRDIEKRWSKFNIEVLYYVESENSYVSLFKYENLNLNVKSKDYICRVIGTEHDYYDHASEKIITSGKYGKTNNHVYVEVTNDVEDGVILSTLMPSGFQNYPTINTTGLHTVTSDQDTLALIQNPIRFSGNRQIQSLEETKPVYKDNSTWGISFNPISLIKIKDVLMSGKTYNFVFEKVKETQEDHFNQATEYSKYFSSMKSSNNIWDYTLEQANQHSFFHLEKILYNKSGSNVTEKWDYAFYRRDGKSVQVISSLGHSNPSNIDENYRYVSINEVLSEETNNDSENSMFLTFEFFSYGGFDGVNILDQYKKEMSHISVAREENGELAGEDRGQTFYAYDLASNLATNESNCRVDLFSMPSISAEKLIRKNVELAEDRRLYSYIFDIPVKISGENQQDPYYFFNVNNRPSDLLDYDENIKDALNDYDNIISTINNFRNMYLNSKYCVGLYNYCEAIVNNSVAVEIPPSISYINSLSRSLLAQPIDSVLLEDASPTLSISSTINMQFKFNCNLFDKLLKETKKLDASINPIGMLTQNNFVKTLSANTLFKNNMSVFRVHHNLRIYLDIVRNIRNLLFTEPVIGESPVLFGPNTIESINNRIDVNLLLALENLMSTYVDSDIINDYFVDVIKINNKQAVKDKLNNTLSGSVGINFRGSRSSDLFAQIELNNLLNIVNNFEDDNNITIRAV